MRTRALVILSRNGLPRWALAESTERVRAAPLGLVESRHCMAWHAAACMGQWDRYHSQRHMYAKASFRCVNGRCGPTTRGRYSHWGSVSAHISEWSYGTHTPTWAATTRACASRRAVRLWWNRRRYVRRLWSDWSGYVEMPRSLRSAVQPPVTRMTKPAEIGVALLLCTLGAFSPVWVL